MNNFQNPYMPQYTQRAYNNGITWVQGIEGAKAYQLMPNSNVMLLDSESDGIFYIKVSDNVGMCSLRTFKFEEITNYSKTVDKNVDMSQYITRDEFEKVIGGLKNEQSISAVKPNKQHSKPIQELKQSAGITE